MEERQEPKGTGEPVAERARIAGVEAGVAAGLVPSTEPARPPRDVAEDSRGRPEDTTGEKTTLSPRRRPGATSNYELPSWTDPPTLQVPRVLLDLEQEAAAGRGGPPPTPPGGPVWRERQEDWNDTDTILADLAALGVADYEESSSDDPFAYDFLDLDEEPSWPTRPEVPATKPGLTAPLPQPPAGVEARTEPEPTSEPNAEPETSEAPAATTGAFEPAPGTDEEGVAPGAQRRRHAVSRARVPRAPRQAVAANPQRTSGARNPVVATLTGLALAAVLLLCFLAGPPAVLALVAVAVTLATAELFSSFRAAGFKPATLLALLAVPAVTVLTYFRGPAAIGLVAVAFTALTTIWYLAGITRRSRVTNLAVTVFGFAWIGVMGSFAGLILDPRVFPHRHGIAIMLALCIGAVGYDVGGYVIGSRLGRHPLARSVSPNKTWEGLIGGCVVAIAASVGITSQIHPWKWSTALALGAIVAVVAPFGDLVESMVKRDLGVKDMGALLPGHGGMLDRIDALLFVLPATYYFVRLAHIG